MNPCFTSSILAGGGTALALPPQMRCAAPRVSGIPFPKLESNRMPDDRTVTRRVLLRLLGSPLVLAPTVLGATASLILWAADGKPGFGWFAALAGLLASAGVYLTKALLDNGRTARRVLAEMEQEAQAAWQAALDDLDRRLVRADQDPRPEMALRDLRALLRAFEDSASQSQTEHLATIVEVRSRVRHLFDHAVRALEQTMKLYETARQLHTPDARRPLLDERERILADVQVSVRQLGTTLATLQKLGAGTQGSNQLARLRQELDQGLEVASRVEARLDDLLHDRLPTLGETLPRPTAEPNVKGN